uniref:TctD-like protein n=1 Tax=Anotrichium furcellatum TaxID=41999 RepID=A0A4D6WKW6_9FLOR|nr:hypothetical protein [Anotrichium furcellatum]
MAYIKRLLIVDDDSNLTQMLAKYLLSEGFIVDIANDVYSALVLIKYNRPHLIISDIIMARLNGYDFIKVLKKDKNLCMIPVIFLTAKGMTKDRIKGYKLGCHAYIAKPFDPKELLSIIFNVFNQFKLAYEYNKYYINQVYQNNKFLTSLTSREKSVLSLLMIGHTNKEIGYSLNISIRNVEKNVSRLLYKTGTRNRTELLKFFVDNNLKFEGE